MSKLYVNEIHPKTAGSTIITTGLGLSNVLETLTLPCDGSSITLASGTYTSQNVTGIQSIGSTTYADVTGSSINYTPPAGAKYVIYSFNFHTAWINTQHAIQNFKFFIDGTEVTYARFTRSGQLNEVRASFEWSIGVGGTANTNTGRQSSWTSSKTLKLQSRDHSANANNMDIHATKYYDGAATPQFSMPMITVTALGG
jgi:hypothetical protein